MKKILRQLIIILCLLAAPLGLSAQSIVFHLSDGDMTLDLPATFTVTPAGDMLLIGIGNGQNLTLSKDDVQFVTYLDADGAQRVDVGDIATIVSLLKSSSQSSGTAPANVEAVDLGLPSGTLWANMNIGATSPENSGNYFAWGETSGYNNGKVEFDWSNYKWSEGTYTDITKYCNWDYYGYNGFTDNKTLLDSEDDAAYVSWGADWRMPTKAQFEELISSDYTTTEWTTQGGAYGRKITSKINGKSIFLPAAGSVYSGSVDGANTYGQYWSRSLYETKGSCNAWKLDFSSSVISVSGSNRCNGYSVRPVIPGRVLENIVEVDLGLPSGTLWASANIGASSPEDYGDYFAWGETTGYKAGKTSFSWSNYKWCMGSETTLTKYVVESFDNGYNGFKDYKKQLDPVDDAAYVNWGTAWRMPTGAQFRELFNSDYTTTEWTTQNGVPGCKITSKTNGNSIFLPAAGFRQDNSLTDAGSRGRYWASGSVYDTRGLCTSFDQSIITHTAYNRCNGFSVRPVRTAWESVAVDLGLTSGTKWANMNVGANRPEGYGDYFAWAETYDRNKTKYGWDNYLYCEGSSSTLTKYCTKSNYGYNGFTDNLTELELDYDAAYIMWGFDWRMPSQEQFAELRNQCTWTWTTKNNVNGYEVTGPNGNSIFLPATGYRSLDKFYNAGSYGYYWSRTLYGDRPDQAWSLYFDQSYQGATYYSRSEGRTVRAVLISE